MARSAAIAIRPPPAPGSVPAPPRSPAPTETTSNNPKLCRNIAIYGSCKFEGKGCIYSHDPDAASGKGKSATNSPIPPIASLPVASTSNAAPANVQSAINAPIFVPKFGLAGSATSTPSGSVLGLTGTGLGSRSATPDFRPANEVNGGGGSDVDQQHFYEAGPSNAEAVSVSSSYRRTPPQKKQRAPRQPSNGGNNNGGSRMAHSSLPAPSASSSGTPMPFDPFGQMHQSNPPFGGPPQGFDGMGLDPFYHGSGRDPNAFHRQQLHYHLYAPPLPHVSAHHPHQLALQNFFLSHNIREELQRKSEAIWQGLGHGEGLDVNGYYGLYPLDTPSDRPPREINGQPGPGIGYFGFRSWVYKAGSEKDGKCYVLRRLENFRLAHEASLQLVEKWRRLRHPNVVGVREAFTTRAFGDNSIVFVYDFHPLANTIMDLHLQPKPMAMRANGRMPQPPAPLNERVFWSYVAQLTSAIRSAHQAGLAVRTIDPTKILVTGKNRLRINCCSIFDVTRYDETAIPSLQQEDLFDLGKLLVALACGSPSAVHNLPRSLEHIGRQYSPDVQKTILFLFSTPTAKKTIDEVLEILGHRILDEFNASQNHDDALEAELMREVENGRLVRLMSKFGFINERPEFDHDPKWAESGDRYVIKLFRDYVFHQIDERGRPLVDLSHVLTCLNKLDAGIDERVTLVSRDAQTCLVVSYREVKSAVEQAYRDLRNAGLV